MKKQNTDFLQRHGITKITDNLGDGGLKISASLLAQLFGTEFIQSIQNSGAHNNKGINDEPHEDKSEGDSGHR